MAGIPSNSMNLNATISGIVNWDGSSVMSVTPLTQYSTLAAGSSNTIAQVSPSTAGYVLTSNGPINFPTYQVLPASGVVQQVYSQSNTYHNYTTVIPLDDTIPQNTEGTEFLTATITPTSATNILYIEFNFWGSSTANYVSIAALFQDSTANALEAQFVGSSTVAAEQAQAGVLRYQMVAGTTSSTTFKIRVGPSAFNMYVNGDSGGRRFGGAGRCTLTVVEYKP